MYGLLASNFSDSVNSVRIDVFCAQEKRVGNLLLYRDYRQNNSNICMYSVLYPESNLVRFSRVVPETLRISSEGILVRYDENQIPSISKCQNRYNSISSAH